MATIKTDLICNLNQPVAATFLHGNLFSQDNAGNTINVYVMENGEPATIGGTVSANVIRADGNTVAVSGAIDGNKAYVILPQACYAVPGRVEIIIKLTQSTTITTIAAIVANVYRSTTDTVVDPGTIIPSISSLIAEIEEAVDSIPVDYTGLLHTIAADYSSSKTYPMVGTYAWQGGVLKRNIVPITTAETYTAAHWTNAVIGDDLTNLKSAFDVNQKNVFNVPTTFSGITDSTKWNVGSGIAPNSGANQVNSKRCRTGYISFSVPTLLYIDSPDYDFIVWEYSSASVSSALFAPRESYTSDPVLIRKEQGAVNFRIGVSRKDGADMAATDVTALTTAIKTFALTDTTLLISGSAADSKATGERCDAIEDYAETTPFRPLTSGELSEASTLLDISPSRYFTADGTKIKTLEPNFPFDIGTSLTYFVMVYKYATSHKYIRILSVDGKKDFTGWTAASHPTTLYWEDISYNSSTFKPTLKVLIFGNSSTYSTWGYLPSLLSEFCPDYNFKIGILYTSGQSLGGHITMFNAGTAYTEFSVFADGVWTNTANTVTGKNALDSDEWDIIAIQQSNGEMMSGTGKADISGLCALIAAYIDYPVQFVINMPMTKGANCSGLEPYYPDIEDPEERSDAAFADFAEYCREGLAESYISHVIPCGTAVQNARHTTLKQYGTFEYLCDDDVGHLQNGIGVLCASYAAAYKFLEIIGEKAKLFGSPLNPTDEWLADINLYTKTAHGSCVGVTDANKILAQRCALQAIKNPYVITVLS